VSIDPNSHVPIYQQIVEHVRRSVAAGAYRPGEPIPSLRQMALDLVVNPNTVQRAYEQLERDGLIEARKGRGMFVTNNGVASALSSSAAAVRSAFTQGIRAGQAAKMPDQQIRGTFDRAWDDAKGTAAEDSR
jgi:GntR family transcriptional regulator